MRSLPFPRSMLCLFPPSLLGLGLGLGFVDFDSSLNLKFIGKKGVGYNRNKPLKMETGKSPKTRVLAGKEVQRSKTLRFGSYTRIT